MIKVAKLKPIDIPKDDTDSKVLNIEMLEEYVLAAKASGNSTQVDAFKEAVATYESRR